MKNLRHLICRRGEYAYRGQEKAEWDVTSCAYRQLRPKPEDDPEPTLEQFIEYHENELIEPARRDGHGERDGRILHDLELLTDLQHYGARTCLIDFTYNFLIALWFACKGSKQTNPDAESAPKRKNNASSKESEQDNTDGKVFIVNTNNPTFFRTVRQGDLKEDKGIRHFLQRRTTKHFYTSTYTDTKDVDSQVTLQQPSSLPQPYYWYWAPQGMNNRILKQDGLFIFRRFDIDKHHMKEIIVEKEDKIDILKDLRLLGITRKSLFKDAHGFAESSTYDESAEAIPKKELFFIKGNYAAQIVNFPRAVELYTRVLDIDPKYAAAYINRGNAKQSLGNLQGAIRDYDEAIDLDPNNAAAYFIRGFLKQTLGDLRGAIEDYDKSIKIDPEYDAVYFSRGFAKQTLEDLQGAIEDYDEAINLNPTDVASYSNRGIAKVILRNFACDIEDFDKAIEINPSNAVAYFNRGTLRLAQGELRRCYRRL